MKSVNSEFGNGNGKSESILECLGNVVFGIPHEHFFDFGAEFFFFGAEFLGSPLNGAE